MQRTLNKPPFSSLVHQICGTPDLLAGLSLVTLGLTCFDPRLWILDALWICVLAPLAWSRFRQRLLLSGVGFRPLPAERLGYPVLAGAGIGLLLCALVVARFHGPIPEELQDTPLVNAACGWVLALTGALVAASLRWLRWFGYALVLALGSATLFLGVPAGWPLLATGLLMAGCGLVSLRGFLRRHPQVLGC